MSQIPTISEKLKEQLLQKGYNSVRPFQINRLPKWATPRTKQYNLMTAFLVGSSLFGLIYAKRKGLYYQGFAFALGSVFVIDYMHRRNLDKTTKYSYTSSGSLEFELEKYPLFKEAFQSVNKELDDRITELRKEKALIS